MHITPARPGGSDVSGLGGNLGSLEKRATTGEAEEGLEP